MNDFKVNNSKWHVRLIALDRYMNYWHRMSDGNQIFSWDTVFSRFYRNYDHVRLTNFCLYWRRVTFILLRALFGWVALLGVIAAFILNSQYVGRGVINFGIFLIIFAIAVGLAAGLAYSFMATRRFIRNRNSVSDPGLIKTWYSSKKNKFCPAVTFEDEPKDRWK